MALSLPPHAADLLLVYALDNSEFPCYLVWPQRDGQSYAYLLDTATNDTLQLSEQCPFRPLGMHHFYDSFAIVSQIGIREDALVLFHLQEEELLSDLRITRQAVLRKRYDNHQEQFLDQYAQEADRYNIPSDVPCVAAREVASDDQDVVPLITQKLFFAIWGICWYNLNVRNSEVSHLNFL